LDVTGIYGQGRKFTDTNICNSIADKVLSLPP
jgi:hypothetical protein